MLETLDATVVRRWSGAGLTALRAHQREIDELNVYPVPDGDTGTNLVLTFTSAQRALALDLDNSAEAGRTAHGHALHLLARGALLGARGNSGVIISQVLRGLADTLADVPEVRGRALAAALRAATAAAYSAVAEPVEGTVLSVLSAAADGAARAGTDDVAAVARAAAEAAAVALARTPEQLPVLARAGVVDAGGRGLCLLLDALAESLSGDPAPIEEPPVPPSPGPRPPATPRETGSPDFAYEVQYLLDAEDDAIDRLRRTLHGLGDSLVVVGSGGRPPVWHVHVHVNDVGAAIEAGVVAGRPHQITVTRFADHATAPPELPAPPARARAAVVMADGPGLAELYTGEGAIVVGDNPSPRELLEAIAGSDAVEIVLLPNDGDTRAVAVAAAREVSGPRVSVVPTRSPVQTLAALAVRDDARSFEDDVIAMAEAAGACRWAEVTRASREALTMAGRCRAGDALGLIEGEVALIGADLTAVGTELLDRLLGGGGELVTLLFGADAPPGLEPALRAHLATRWPYVEARGYDGGQPVYPLLIGVE
ncbi:DAK2 domain fusion protein YloV [Catenuloplanes nepalensis]|uniref:DAK2 domain fusion protein YloV n=1 Tax=Catenuloplanes nepalensis TaxID=587533 RepID=A0ABT9N179_9ACTN|nr:DAK2 domain-containing protein [Catenuloplanes nepalensis]MDP9797191.1 DAK2 domain fusion protein YloV [Catenuloplanes nepalensis]